MKKIKTLLLIILFPIGILYCIAKCSFTSGFSGFLGSLLIAGLGILCGIYIAEPTIIINILNKIPFINIGA